MEKPGFIYFVADRNKMFTKDSADFDYLNITTQPVRPPTAEQIINCQNWRNSTSEYCFRIAFFGSLSQF